MTVFAAWCQAFSTSARNTGTRSGVLSLNSAQAGALAGRWPEIPSRRHFNNGSFEFSWQFRDGDKLQSGAGCGKCGQAFLRDRSSKECDSRPHGVCRVPPNPSACRRADDAPCRRRCPKAIGFYVPRPRRWRCPSRRVARRPCRLFRLGSTRLVAGFPRFEFAGQVLPPRCAQFADDSGMLCGQPVLKFVERFDGRKNGGGDFNSFRFHVGFLSRLAGKRQGFFEAILIMWGMPLACQHLGIGVKPELGSFSDRCHSLEYSSPSTFAPLRWRFLTCPIEPWPQWF